MAEDISSQQEKAITILLFYKEAKRALRRDGILAVWVQPSSGYVGRTAKKMNGAIYGSLLEVFEEVEMSTEEYGLMMASDSHIMTDPEKLAERFRRHGFETKFARPYIFIDAFDVQRTEQLKERLQGVGLLNQDNRPMAYLYNLMQWAEMQDAGWLKRILSFGKHAVTVIAVCFILAAAASFRKVQRSMYYAVFTSGFASIGFVVVVMLAFQAKYGYVYVMFGFLSAVFMTGMAAGAFLADPLKLKDKQDVFMLEILCALLAGGATLSLDLPYALYVIGFVAGALAGLQFSAVSGVLSSISGISHGGKMYAVDLIGAFIGALCISVMVVPVAGLGGTLFLMFLIKSISAVTVGLARNA
jgi:spermidine synthase